MSLETNKVAAALFEKVRSRFENVSLGDEASKATQDPETARFFNFDYTVNGDNYGNITLSLADADSLKVYFSKNISSNLEGEDKQDWFNFLKELRHFAKRNMLAFDTRDISRANLGLKDIQTLAKTDDNFAAGDVQIANESKMYGSNITSFQDTGSAKLRIRHNGPINLESRGARTRNINAIFVENNQGERFKLPFTNVTGARAMARHISEGGAVHDDIGKRITDMVQEMSDMRTFVRQSKTQVFEDPQTAEIATAAVDYYYTVKESLTRMNSSRGYAAFKENFAPSDELLVEEDVLAEIKDKFTKRVFDTRLEAALPRILAAYKLKENKKMLQTESVMNVIKKQQPLVLRADEGFDSYIRTLNYADTKKFAATVLENIASRIVGNSALAEFAHDWATKITQLDESASEQLKEEQQLAVKLVTHYLRDLQEMASNPESVKKIREIAQTVKPSKKVQKIEEVFEEWANVVSEGTWAIPDTDEKKERLRDLLSGELIVGVDATNATGALYDLIGDDDLFDLLNEIAEEDPDADVASTVKYWLKNRAPEMYAGVGFDAADEYDTNTGDYGDDDFDQLADYDANAKNSDEIDEARRPSQRKNPHDVIAQKLKTQELLSKPIPDEVYDKHKRDMEAQNIAYVNSNPNSIYAKKPVLSDASMVDVISSSLVPVMRQVRGGEKPYQAVRDVIDQLVLKYGKDSAMEIRRIAKSIVDSDEKPAVPAGILKTNESFDAIGEITMDLAHDMQGWFARIFHKGELINSSRRYPTDQLAQQAGRMLMQHYSTAGVDDFLEEDELTEASSDAFGVRYRVFAGREGRVETKEKFFATKAALDRFAAKIEQADNFYEFDAWKYPNGYEGEVVTEISDIRSLAGLN